MENKQTIERTFGIVLRRLREKTGLSHINFSTQIGVNRSHYGRIERGESSAGIGMIEKLSHGLNLEVSELMILVDKERKRILRGFVVKVKSNL